MSVYRYSRESANAFAVRQYRQFAPHFFVLLLVLLATRWYLSSAPPTWKHFFNSAEIALPVLIIMAAGFGFLRSRALASGCRISPESIQSGPLNIPRAGVREIEIAPMHVAIHAAGSRQRIEVTAEIERYETLLAELRAWKPEAIRHSTASGQRRLCLKTAGMAALIFGLSYAVERNPRLVLQTVSGGLFFSPILYFRQRSVPPLRRWLNSASALALAAMLLFISWR